MGFFDGGSSEQNQYSGLRAPGWENYGAFKGVLDRTGGAGGDYGFLIDSLKGQIGTAPKVNSSGFFDQQMEGVNVFGRNLFNNISSNYAGRGFLSPESVSGVIGSAVREASPQLMGMVGQNVLSADAMAQNRFGALNQALQLAPALLGSESHSKQEGPNLLAQNVAQWTNPNSYANLIQAVGSLKGGATPGGR